MPGMNHLNREIEIHVIDSSFGSSHRSLAILSGIFSHKRVGCCRLLLYDITCLFSFLPPLNSQSSAPISDCSGKAALLDALAFPCSASSTE